MPPQGGGGGDENDGGEGGEGGEGGGGGESGGGHTSFCSSFGESNGSRKYPAAEPITAPIASFGPTPT
jgi:hypothetical protein